MSARPGSRGDQQMFVPTRDSGNRAVLDFRGENSKILSGHSKGFKVWRLNAEGGQRLVKGVFDFQQDNRLKW